MHWATLNLRNMFYAVGFVIFLLFVASKAFAFWLPPLLEMPPFLMEPPHIEGGCHPAMEKLKHEMEEKNHGGLEGKDTKDGRTFLV